MSGGPRVLLTVLFQRTSARGRPHLSGWLGKARVVAFAGEPDAQGDPTWTWDVTKPEPRDGLQRLPPRPPERDSGSGRKRFALGAAAHPLTPPGGSSGAIPRPWGRGQSGRTAAVLTGDTLDRGREGLRWAPRTVALPLGYPAREGPPACLLSWARAGCRV